jgi:tRNA (mo5U34)-methyltransferase
MDIGELSRDLGRHVERLRAARASVPDPPAWYLYETLSNVSHLDALLEGTYRDLGQLAGGRPVADIGAADGDLAFTLEAAAGWTVDIIDTAKSNMNGLEGARRLRAALGSQVSIHDIDLDSQFRLPRESYGLVIFLGILYHLQNPFYALHQLAAASEYCLMSTRVARFAGPERTSIADLPIGYLVGPAELNDDASNYWIFSPAGVERIVSRAGWDIISGINVGAVETSTPDSLEHDERMFVLLRSTR